MNYPIISEYIKAIKAAEDNFDKLKHLRPVLDDDGQPVMYRGNFAVVFKMTNTFSGKLYALKCFLKEQEGRQEAYRLISEELERMRIESIKSLNNDVENIWSFFDFCRTHGRMKRGSFPAEVSSSEENKYVQRLIFPDAKEGLLFLDFSSQLGELSHEELIEKRYELQVVQFVNGRYELYPIEEPCNINECTYFTHIKYIDKELFVDTNASDEKEFPVLLMDWVQGVTLDKYIREHIDDEYELSILAYQFSRLAMWLMPQPFAHGDLKPDNILVREDGTLVLVDYDGMYVPAMKGQKARELGSPDFRHPSRTEDDFDEHIDDFSIASILLSLKAIALHPTLLDKYGTSDRLLLSEEDYRSISQSRFIKQVFPSCNMELNKLINVFMIALSEYNLSSVSISLFNIQDPKLEFFSTEVTDEELANAWIDEFGVKYCLRRKCLLEVPKNLSLSDYVIKEGTIIIGDNAFYGNTTLISISIPNTVELIGNNSFRNCKSLLSISIPNSVKKIGKNAFDSCSSIQTIILPNGITSIEEDTFFGCKSLQTIDLPDSLKIIKKYAFRRCETIQIIKIPNNVTSIGFGVFHGCTSLRSIVIPDSVISIDDLGDISPNWIFVSPTSFDRIKWMLNSELQQWLKLYTKEIDEFGATYSEDGKTLLKGPESNRFKDYPIRKGTITIGKNAFSRRNFHSISIPNTVTTIGNNAFYDCRLHQIEIPNSVTSIGDYAFALSKYLKTVTIPDSVTHIGAWAFYYCESLVNLNIPNSVIYIGSHAFSECKSLQSITIPPSVREIHGNPFIRYNGKIISKSKYFTVYNGNLYDSEISTLISYNSKEREFSIPDSVRSIGDKAFSGCSELLSINIPDSVSLIGEGAFDWCYNLRSVTIPNTVKSIGENAFDGCHSLLSVNIPNSLTDINDCLFYNCESLCTIEIPESVTSIGNSAFCNCSSLQEITIPDSITSIGKGAFRGCSSLHNCIISNHVSSISERTFCECKSLKEVFLPDSIKSIGDHAFEQCEGLIYVSYSHHIFNIGMFAFSDCTKLKTVEIHTSESNEESSSSVLSTSLHINPNLSSNALINDGAFSNCISLLSINISHSITSIGEYAFVGCESLRTIEIPDSVTFIGKYAFKNCKHLESIILSKTLKTIPDNIFEYCDSLKTISIPDSVIYIGSLALIFLNSIYVSKTSYERIKSILPNYCQNKLKIRDNNVD